MRRFLCSIEGMVWLCLIKCERRDPGAIRSPGETGGAPGLQIFYSWQTGPTVRKSPRQRSISGCYQDKLKPGTWLVKPLIKASETSKSAHQRPFPLDKCLLSILIEMHTLSPQLRTLASQGHCPTVASKNTQGGKGPSEEIVGIPLFKAVG